MKRKLYSAVIENKKFEKQKLHEEYEAKKYYKLDNDEKVVVIRENKSTRLLKIISYKFEELVRIVSWLILMGIVSVGVTVLLNPSLREQFLSIFK